MTEFIDVDETPTQLKATYTIDGTDYVVTEDVSDVPAPTGYDDGAVEVANYIVANFDQSDAGQEGSTLGLPSQYESYTATIQDTNWNNTGFISVAITDGNSQIVGTVLLKDNN